MTSTLSTLAEHRQGLVFDVTARGHRLVTDYPLHPGEIGAGMRSLELLLASVATCAGAGLIAVMQRRGLDFSGLRVEATAQRRDEHPTVLTGVDLTLTLQSGPPSADLETLWAAAHSLCPVLAMLEPVTPIHVSCRTL